jgi:hypothetical protein
LVVSEQRVVWFLLGFAAATGVLLALAPLPARGQILDPQTRVEPRPQRAPPSGATSAEIRAPSEIDTPFPEGTWGTEVRGTAVPAAAGDSLGTWDTETISDAFEEARARQQRMPQDGDPIAVGEPEAPLDGVIDLNAPNPFADEENATLADLRSPQDIAALGPGGAGFDPLLLQAEEINPVFADRPLRTFEPDPFAPLGVRLGSFVLFTSVEADGDYNSNLFSSPVPLGDFALEVRPAVRLASNWSTHAIEVRAGGDLSYHDKYQSEDDRAYLVESLGRLDVTRRTNLQGAISREYAQESRNAINASSIGTRPNITVDRGRAALNHRFNRLSVQLRGGIVDTSYSTNIFEGMVVSNSDRDYTLYEEAVRPQWEFTPTFFLFSDFAFNQRDYSIPAFTDGIIRSSTGERYRAGVSFGDVGEILRGEVSLGYGRQTPDAQQLEVIDGLLIDANLTWRVTPLTSLLLTASTDVAETTTDDSGGVLERNYAAEVRHSFQTRLVGIAGLSLFTRDFVGAGIHEDQFTAATGLEYYLSRRAVLFGRYQHTVFDTTTPNGNYTVEEVQLGVRLRQ